MEKDFSEERITEYMMEHLLERPSLSEICSHFGYSRNYFAKKFKLIYGIPYTRFMTELIMRDAADMLLQGQKSIHELAKQYGFASSYHFSRAFKRVIGESPRLFKNGDHTIPDMLPRQMIGDQRMFLNYVKTDDATVSGYSVKAENGLKTDLLKECAYHLDHDDPLFDRVTSDEKVSFWWGNSPDSIYYVLGEFDYSTHEKDEKRKTYSIPGTSYAVFSVENTGDREKDLINHREMVRYAMKDWVAINRKKPDRMYYTYEVFDKAYSYLYLPLQEGTISPDLITYMRELNIDNWIPYIDSRIEEDISVKEIAAHFHYSETHFRRTFKMYFEMTPQEYIQKRRLYMAASEIASAKGDKKRGSIAAKYYFHTAEYFNKLFIKEFHMKPEDYKNIRIRAINLAEYYTQQKDSVTVTFSYCDAIKACGFKLNTRTKEQEDFDIPELVSYWLLHDPDEIKGTDLEVKTKGKEDKIAIWQSDESSKGYEYLIGYVVGDLDDAPESYMKIETDTGKYAVFESMNKSDRDDIEDTYRMLSRCSFYGWVKDNRYRVDFNRLTFVRFMGNKLYFYVPINE